LIVYANAGGITGFDRGDQALKMAKCLTADSWLIASGDGVLRRIDQDDHWVVAIRRAVNPTATLICGPDATLLSDADAHSIHSKAMRRSRLLQRYGKTSESPTPSAFATLFEQLCLWDISTMSYVLEHSRGLLAWEFRGGEFGLHCRGLSLDPNAWTSCVRQCAEIVNDQVVFVDTLEKMPVW
jgi:hypothetical protein